MVEEIRNLQEHQSRFVEKLEELDTLIGRINAYDADPGDLTASNKLLADLLSSGVQGVLDIYALAEKTLEVRDDVDAESMHQSVSKALESLGDRVNITPDALTGYLDARIAYERASELPQNSELRSILRKSFAQELYDQAAILSLESITAEADDIFTEPNPKFINNQSVREEFEGTQVAPKLLANLVHETELEFKTNGATFDGKEIEPFKAALSAIKKVATFMMSEPEGTSLPAENLNELHSVYGSLIYESGSFKSTDDPQIIAVRGKIEKLLEVVRRIIHAERVRVGDPTLLQPETRDIAKNIYGDILLLNQSFRVEFNSAEEYGQVLDRNEVLTPQQIAYLRKTLTRVEFLIIRVYGLLDQATSSLVPNEVVFGQDLLNQMEEHAEWIRRVINRLPVAAAPQADEATAIRLLELGLSDDDEASWLRFVREHRESFTVPMLRNYFVRELWAQMDPTDVNEIFHKKDVFQKFKAVIQHLRNSRSPDMRGDVDSLNLANELEYRYRLFDAMNPHALSSAMTASTSELGGVARANKFERTVFAWYLGTNKEGPAGTERKNYEHSEIIRTACEHMEDYFFEPPDPDLVIRARGGRAERPDSLRTESWGADFNRASPVDGQAEVTFAVRKDLQGKPKGRFVKGYFSYFVGNWTSASVDIRDEMTQRLKVDLEPMFAAKGITDDEEKDTIVQIAKETAATANIRGSLFAICYAIGMSPPGGVGKVIDDLKDTFPIALELNDACRTVRMIPSVVEGLDIPSEFIEQMRFLLLEGSQYWDDPKKRGQALNRFETLQESIGFSTKIRELFDIPQRGHVELMNIRGKEVHLDQAHHPMGAHTIQPGERVREKLLLLPALYTDLYTSLMGAQGAKMAEISLELADWFAAREEYIKLHHQVEAEISYSGDPDQLIEAICIDILNRLQIISGLKRNELAGNFREVGELYYRRLAYLIRYYVAKTGRNPLDATNPLVSIDKIQNPRDLTWRGVLRVLLASGGKGDSLVVALKRVIEDPTQTYVESNWQRIFEHPYELMRKPGELLDMKEWLSAHFPTAGDSGRYRAAMLYLLKPSGYDRKLKLKVNIALGAASTARKFWNASYDGQTLQKKKLLQESKEKREGENEHAEAH